MGMVFCRGCGKEIHETAPTCPHCGAPQGRGIETSKDSAIPDGIKGWSWGAFLLNWIWAIGNKTWIGLFAIIPYVGLIMAIVLGFKGREWAWKNKQWESVEHFNSVQKKWSVWGVAIVIGVFVIGILAAIAIPAYQDYVVRAKQAEFNQTQASEESAEVTPQEQESLQEATTSSEDVSSETTEEVSAVEKWTEGYGQGNLEYFIDKQGFRLYIGCPTEDGSADSPSSVSLSVLSNNTEIVPFTITVNGTTYDAPFSADSRVGENNFISLLENLHKGNAVVTFGGTTISFPRSNAQEVIPLFGKNGFSCNLNP